MTMESFVLSDDGASSNNNPFTHASASIPKLKMSPRDGVIKLGSERKQLFFKSASEKIKEADLGVHVKNEPTSTLHAQVSAQEGTKLRAVIQKWLTDNASDSGGLQLSFIL